MRGAIVLFCVLACAAAADWSYAGDHGPAHWPDIAPACGGKSQSPINLKDWTCKASTKRPKTKLDETFDGTAVNNGHTIQVNVPAEAQKALTVQIGGKSYNVLQFHFHWGTQSGQGSEHLLGGKAYDMEMHIVTGLNGGTSDLAVLGFFVEVTDVENGALAPLVNVLTKLNNKDASVPVTFNLQSLVRYQLNGQLFRYQGSLTTPPCSEIVTWTLYKRTIQISQTQIDAFRGVGGIEPNNFRPVQSINDRLVSYKAKC